MIYQQFLSVGEGNRTSWIPPLFILRFSAGLLLCGFCARNHSCFEFMYATALLCPSNNRCSHTVSGSYKLPISSSMMIPELWGRGCEINILFGAERSTVSHSLHVDHLCSVLITFYCGTKPLWWELRDALICLQRELCVPGSVAVSLMYFYQSPPTSLSIKAGFYAREEQRCKDTEVPCVTEVKLV